MSHSNTARDRETLAKGRSKYPGKQIRPAYLRYEIVLDNNKTSYRIQLTSRQNGRATERFLQNTDCFLVEDMGIFLFAQDARKPGTGQLLTYPSPTALATAYGVTIGTAPGSGFPAAVDLEAVYAGTAQLTIDKQIEMDGFDLRRARFVPQTQAGTGIDKDQADYTGGYIPLEPGFDLNGTKQAELLLSLPAFTGGQTPVFAATASNYEVGLAIIFRGYEVAAGSGLSR
jgi:hypothetical protein